MFTTSAMTEATIQVPSLKVTVPLAAAALPRDLVPMDGPAGEPVLDLVLEGGALTVRAKLNGKNYRKLLKQVAEHGAEFRARGDAVGERLGRLDADERDVGGDEVPQVAAAGRHVADDLPVARVGVAQDGEPLSLEEDASRGPGTAALRETG